MSGAALVAGVSALSLAAMRHLLVLGAIVRSRRFLTPDVAAGDAIPAAALPVFYIVIPVLREACVLRHALAHFETIAEGHQAQIVVVTTARETAERARHQGLPDTICVAEELARQDRCLHLHYPDPAGRKADQLNFVVDHCVAVLDDAALSRSFLLCYDADSRPPLDSLAWFEEAIARHPNASVFHQSSRFELRQPPQPRHGVAAWLQRAVADSGTLRANRFVLGYEIPRLLNRSAMTGALKRKLCSFVYAHVTGHGLCVRVSLLRALPLPEQSPLEDMHYSFVLGSRNFPMVPIPSLDCAEVPAALRIQVQQAARWFFGPARFRIYLRDPRTKPGPRARLLALSALAICLEWLSCAVVPALLALALWRADGLLRTLAAGFIVVYGLQLLATEAFTGSPVRLRDRIGRVLAYPVASTLFGVGGIIGAAQLLGGGVGAGKTERLSA